MWTKKLFYSSTRSRRTPSSPCTTSTASSCPSMTSRQSIMRPWQDSPSSVFWPSTTTSCTRWTRWLWRIVQSWKKSGSTARSWPRWDKMLLLLNLNHEAGNNPIKYFKHNFMLCSFLAFWKAVQLFQPISMLKNQHSIDLRWTSLYRIGSWSFFTLTFSIPWE